MDNPFQKIRFDKSLDCFQSKLTHQGQKIEFYFQVNQRSELDRLVAIARQFWRSRVKWFKAFREFVAEELIDELNDILDEGQDDFRPVTKTEIRKHLKAPFSVQLTPEEDDSSVLIEMNGGESPKVFKECCFEVFLDLEEGIQSGEVVTLL